MRFKITLQTYGIKDQSTIPLSYQYELSSWIYNLINTADPLFSNWLHSKGYMINGKSFKLFTFSHIQIPGKQFKIHEDRLIIQTKEVAIYVSFLLDTSAVPFISGLFSNKLLCLGDQLSRSEFNVSSIECLSDPVFHNSMSFHTISPIVINQYDNKHGKYLSPEDPGYESLFFQNLVKKYCAVTVFESENADPEANNASVITKFELLSKPKSKLVKIKAGTINETNVRGFMFDFKLTCPASLMRTGYHAGFGEKNSMGFGCGEVRLD
jgi:CRISPR-associated endoribonuclease Cas6